MSKLQDADFKTLAQLTALGGDQTDLLNTTKIYSPKATDQLEDALRKNNFSATGAPAVSNDNTEGYEVGSFWHDTTNDESYVALDVSTGAAVWKTTTATGGGGGTLWTNGGALDINGTTTDPTKGTTTADKYWYKILDDNTLFGFIEYEQTSAGTAGSGDYIINVAPSGYQIDNFFDRSSNSINDLRSMEFGAGLYANNSTAGATTSYLVTVTGWDADHIRILLRDGTNTGEYWRSASNSLAGATRYLYAYFTLPIATL